MVRETLLQWQCHQHQLKNKKRTPCSAVCPATCGFQQQTLSFPQTFHHQIFHTTADSIRIGCEWINVAPVILTDPCLSQLLVSHIFLFPTDPCPSQIPALLNSSFLTSPCPLQILVSYRSLPSLSFTNFHLFFYINGKYVCLYLE